ncbi:M50 family metallopeptidase [Pedosphaera parvula]|uniref:Peptidase M50 domain-containing protein n=1 Tax=Pedosphaera parvula (strain Ellin514) TaxID=320771 RepID=B9XH02_PEDPL|nr:M50 family metallopeptidase [Pedosphaera parvula]EEF60923.1 hypothetical protein Cflav_PD4092 [Pedosphaera parvula Ellin514]
MSIKCDRCGTETSIEGAFYRIEVPHSSRVLRRCPECWLEVTKGAYKRTLAAYAMCGIISLLFLWLPADKTFGMFLLNLLLFYVLMIPTTLPHEFGHAFAAQACGCRVYHVIIGLGATVYERSFCGFNLQFNSIPFGGFAIWAHRTTFAYRRKELLAIFAGPLANLLLAGVTLLLFPEQALNFNVMGGIQPASMFLLANLFLFTFNLWPRRIHTVFGDIPNDGLSIWKTLHLSDNEIALKPLGYYNAEGQKALQEKNFGKAYEILHTGLNLYPDNLPLLSCLGATLLAAERFTEARDVFLDVLNRPNLPANYRCLMLNNIAYANSFLGGEALIKEADRFSEAVLVELPFVPAYRGTRGTVLVEMGRLNEGIALLKEAMEKHSDNESKAGDACHIAIAEKRRGNLEECKRFTDLARTLDPKCTLLKRVEAASLQDSPVAK